MLDEPQVACQLPAEPLRARAHRAGHGRWRTGRRCSPQLRRTARACSRHFRAGDPRRRPPPSATPCASTSGASGIARPRPPRSRQSLAAAGLHRERRGGATAARAARLARWCASSMSRGAGGCRRCCRRCSRTSPRSSAQLPVLRRVLADHRGDRQALGLLRAAARERPARARLVELCGHGEFLAAQIAAHPLLLDELIDERLLSQLPSAPRSRADLRVAHADSCEGGGSGAAGGGAAPFPERGAVSHRGRGSDRRSCRSCR